MARTWAGWVVSRAELGSGPSRVTLRGRCLRFWVERV